MNKEKAIKEVYKQKEEQAEEMFQQEVEGLVCAIEETSNHLRGLKARLTKLEYEKPEILGNISTPKAEALDKKNE
ncbi:MAG TPA: hypothetical protein ENI23_16310 [bacterium]|nr:hypothetical protein [bacterium]